MAKIMEILEIKPNYSTGQTKLKLGDTGFNTTGKTYGTDATVDYLNAVDNDIVAFQVIHTLYDAQQTYKPRLQNWTNDINNWVDGVRGSVSGLDSLSYFQPPAFQSAYNKGIYADGVPTDWDNMKLFVQEEKDLYDYTFKAEQWITQTILKEDLATWSEGRNYGSTVKEFAGKGVELDEDCGASITSVSGGYTARIVQYSGDTHYPILENTHTIPVGGEVTVVTGHYYTYQTGHDGQSTVYVGSTATQVFRKEYLGVAPDDGYMKLKSYSYAKTSGKDSSGFRNWYNLEGVKAYSGNQSPHFTDAVPTQPYRAFLEGRVYK